MKFFARNGFWFIVVHSRRSFPLSPIGTRLRNLVVEAPGFNPRGFVFYGSYSIAFPCLLEIRRELAGRARARACSLCPAKYPVVPFWGSNSTVGSPAEYNTLGVGE